MIGYEQCGISSYYTDVVELPSANSVNGQATVPVGPFDPDKVDFGKVLGLAYEEGAFA